MFLYVLRVDSMKRCATKSGIKAAALAVLSVLLLSACEDQRRIVWTADGSLAAVIAGDGLRICDAPGGLGEPRPGVELVEWFPDGRKVLAVEYEKIDTWSKVRDNETASDLKTAIDTAAQIFAASRKSQGDWKHFEKSVEHLPHTREAVIYLR